jgi:hypothetical protein
MGTSSQILKSIIKISWVPMRKWQLLQLVNINEIKLLDVSERGKMPASYMPDFIENIGRDIFII